MLRAKYMKNEIEAKIWAWLISVKKAQAMTAILVAIWLTTIQVFLLPYEKFEYFYKAGAIINLKEKGRVARENRLSVK